MGAVAKTLLDTPTKPVELVTEWFDLWLTECKKAGYVAITDFEKQLFFGANDVSKVIAVTEGKKKQFISLNAFDVDWNNKQFSRQTSRLKQIRNIGIDIDQYNLGLSIDEALDEIQALILSEVIPEPNLVLTSRGIQLFYTVNRGASPEMSWLASYITEQFISKLEHIGADSNAKDMSRVMRVPNSINERNNAVVKPDIWNNEAYTLAELQSYCRPLEQFRSRKKKKDNVINLPINEKLTQYYKTNYARLRDLRTLLELRKGDLTGMRNVFLYIYSYHQALVLNTQKDVLTSVRNTFNDVYSRTEKPISNTEFERTVKSAYKDAEQFFNHFKENGYRVIYKANDGIKKPMKTSTIIDRLSITEEEQYHLGSIRSKEVAKQQDRDRNRQERRKNGQATREEYIKQQHDKTDDKLFKLKELLEANPKAKKTDIAEQLGVTRQHLYRLLKQI